MIIINRFIEPTPLTPGMFGYSILRAGQNREYFTSILDNMEKFNVPIEGLHTETGPGVYPIFSSFFSFLFIFLYNSILPSFFTYHRFISFSHLFYIISINSVTKSDI